MVLISSHVVIKADNDATAINILDLLYYDNTHNVTDMLFDAVDDATDT